jgi:hypothetical protein
MNLKPSVAELQKEHVVMELECIDRMYLNAYVPQLTTEAGVAGGSGAKFKFRPDLAASDSLFPRAPGFARRPFLKFAPEPSESAHRRADQN